MRRIAIFFASAAATGLAVFLFWWFSLGYYRPTEPWLADLYVAKDARAQSISGPKVIVAGGSNALFGIDSELLGKEIGRPVVNLASHGALPLDFHAWKILQHAGKGDLIILPLEFEYYGRTARPTSWHIDNMEGWGHSYIESSLVRTLNYFKYASLFNALKRLKAHRPIPSDPAPLVFQTVAANARLFVPPWVGYSYRSMNAAGDILVDEPPAYHENYAYTKGEVTEHTLTELVSLHEALREKGAALVVTWPATVRNPDFDLSSPVFTKKVEDIAEAIEGRGVTVMCKPEDFQFDRGLFLNTRYHLVARAAEQRTLNLAACLQERPINPLAGENVYRNRLAAASRSLTEDNERVQRMMAIDAQRMRELTVGDLRSIVDALEKYRTEKGSYPLSPLWSGRYFTAGIGPEWIKGLVPRYVAALPRDRRATEIPNQQYLYRSDGKDYKLVAHSPPDCEIYKKNEPTLVDPARDCYAIGFWTEGARAW